MCNSSGFQFKHIRNGLHKLICNLKLALNTGKDIIGAISLLGILLVHTVAISLDLGKWRNNKIRNV